MMKQQFALHAYDRDFCAWSIEQAALLREGRLDLIDTANIAEEIESLSRSDRHALTHRLEVLLAHLLKWHYQPALQNGSWRGTIGTQRRRIKQLLKESPSLFPMLDDLNWQQDVWRGAVEMAEDETQLKNFPVQCPWNMRNEVLGDRWLP